MRRILVLVDSAESEAVLRGERLPAPWSLLSVSALSTCLPPSVRDDTMERVLQGAGEALIVCWDPAASWSRAVSRWWRVNFAEVIVVAPDSQALPSWASGRHVVRYADATELGPAITAAAQEAVPRLRTMAAPEPVTRSVREIVDAASAALEASGVPAGDACAVVADLLDAELAGYPSHGLSRLEEYLDKLRRRVLNPSPTFRVVPLGPGRSVLDADQALGAVVRREVARVIESSQDPILALSVRRSGHLGRLAPLAQDVCALDRLLLGFVNGAGGGQKVVPFGATERRLATNPLVFGFPVAGAPPLAVDVSISAMSDGAVRMAAAARRHLPEGVLADRHGSSVRVPRLFAEALEASLLPLGGRDLGHKGYGLALAVEVIAGVWGGGGFSQPGRLSSGNSAVFFSATLDAMGEDGDLVRENMGRLVAYVTSARSADPANPVRLPGGEAHRPVSDEVRIAPSLARRLGL